MGDEIKKLEDIVNALASMALDNTKFNTIQSERIRNILQKLNIIEELIRDRIPKDFVGGLNQNVSQVDDKVNDIITKQKAVKLERQQDFEKFSKKIYKWLWGVLGTMITIIIQLVILLIKNFLK